MSHFTKITAQVKDLEILAAAAKKMGFELRQNAECRYFYGTKHKDAVVKLPGVYDVGLTKQGNHYSLEADFWGGHVARYVGTGCGILIQKYAAEKARTEAFKLGLGVTERVTDKGVVLTMLDPDSGGQLTIECSSDGEATVKTTGFAGQSCMKFRSLEESLGIIDKTEYTSEFYEEAVGNQEYVYTGY